MKISKHLLSKAGVALCAWAIASTAVAAPPASVLGMWTILTSDTYTVLDITAQGGTGAPGHMAGTYNVLAIAFGDLGEYPFSANK